MSPFILFVVGRNISTKFTPSVYKYILSIECDLEDLRLEDSTVYRLGLAARHVACI